MLIAHVECYLSLRQMLGYKLRNTSGNLRAFARFAAGRGDTHVRLSTAMDWATEGTSPYTRHIRLRDAAQLARFLHAQDPTHEVSSNPFRAPKWRPLPYIYIPEEIVQLVGATSRLRESYPLRRQVYATMLGLIAAFSSSWLTSRKKRGNCAATRNGRLAAVKAFTRYVEFRVPSALAQARQIHAIPGKRHDQALVRHLTMEEVRAILNAPNLTTRLGIRDRAMLHLCFAAGLRVSELVELLLENVSLQPTPSISVFGKGRKERGLPLWKETAADLRAWLAVRGSVPVPELFVNAEAAAMTRAGFEYILDKHVCAATKSCTSLSGRSVSPHQLRHSCAVIMLQATRNIRKVALWLGHAGYSHGRDLFAGGSIGEIGGDASGFAT